MKLRSSVIEQMLRLEQTSSDALREILRIYDHESRTLGNQSKYALTFKTKIDLLFDLGEISDIEYKHLIKLMEIRNQFAHNPAAGSFVSLNKEINNHLLNNCPDEIKIGQEEEKKLYLIFEHLCGLALEKLLIITAEYSSAVKGEIRKHMNDIIIQNFGTVWERALEKNKEKMKTIPELALIINKQTVLDYFFEDLKRSMNEVALEEMQKSTPNLTNILKQKENIEEILKKEKADGPKSKDETTS